MNSREHIQKILKRQKVDCVGLCEAPWHETIRRWKTEGLPTNAYFGDYFEIDIRDMFVIDSSYRLRELIIEETDEYTLSVNAYGNTIKSWKNCSGVSMLLDHAIKTPANWFLYKDLLMAIFPELALGNLVTIGLN